MSTIAVKAATLISVVLVCAGLGLVLIAVEELAGLAWSLLLAGLVCLYGGFVLSTKVSSS